MPVDAAARLWSANTWHQLSTPGAYECWSFDSIDARGNGVSISLFDGLPFHPGYLSAYHRYQWKSQSPNPADHVTPRGYPAAFMAVYQSNRIVARFLNQYPAGAFEQNSDATEIRVGPNRFTLRSDGSLGITAKGYPFDFLRGQPRQRRDQILSATLTFTPTFPGVQHTRPFRPVGPYNTTHNFILAAPHCRVSGRVQHLDVAEVSDSSRLAALDFPIDAMGYHDHHFGASPVSHDCPNIIWGQALTEDAALIWHYAGDWKATDDSPHAAGLLLFRKDQPPIVIDAPTIRLERPRFTRYMQRYPQRITMYGSDAKGHPLELLLNHSDFLTRSPFHGRVRADADLTIAGTTTQAFQGSSQFINTRSLSFPIISDLVLQTILQVDETDPLWRQ